MTTVKMSNDVREYFESGAKSIVKVTANDNYSLTVEFDNGEVKIYDMSDKLYGVFEVLKDYKRFEDVFVDEFGNIAWNIDKQVDSSNHWNNRIDLCSDSVYMESKQID